MGKLTKALGAALGALAIVLSGLALSGTANATVSQTVTCETATANVLKIKAELKVVTDSQDFKNLVAMKANVAFLRGEIVKAQGELSVLLKILVPSKADLERIAILKGTAAVPGSILSLTAQADAGDKAIAEIEGKVGFVQKRLDIALALQKTACATTTETVTPTPTAPPTVTTTVVPTVPVVPTPVIINPVIQTPVGAVQTGGGPA